MRKFKDGGISVCFHCHSQLVRVKGGFIFAEVIDPDGHRLRVHKDCQKHAIGHGYKLPPSLTQQTEQVS
jgi:hypothetical protein